MLTTSEEKLDVEPGPTGGGDDGADAPGGCQRIDFLFVVDNSLSMQDEQENLILAFPSFIDTIENTLEAGDFHIMVVSTDNGLSQGFNSSCPGGECSCSPAPLCCESACESVVAETCLGFECDELPVVECDGEWGAGRQYSGVGEWCNIEGDDRYMRESQENLTDTFACVAEVGLYGSAGERPMQSMTAALQEEINAPGGCNAGFLREDAILVVTVITDEEDDHSKNPDILPGSPGDPPDWVDALVRAKGGDPEAVVFLALVGDGNLEGGQCKGPDMFVDAENSPRLQEVANSLPFGLLGSVCAPNYNWFFEKAVSVIDASCTVFVPPG